MSDGPAIPPHSFQVATFNARRLWQRDQSGHGGFHMLSGILSAEGVDVLCIQEVFAGDFPRLPVNQPYSYDEVDFSYTPEPHVAFCPIFVHSF